jgi:hypothetical protein
METDDLTELDVAESILNAVAIYKRLRSSTMNFSLGPKVNEDSNEEKVAALAEIICQAGDEAAAALFVLMGTLERSLHPKLLANAAKHFAFARCGESNLFGIVDAQLSLVEGELLAS